MKTYIFIIAQLILMSWAHADINAEEPQQIANFKIDGVKHSVVVGHESEIVINKKSHQIILELDPVRKFEKSGISFEYSSDKNFAYQNLSGTVDHWELNGSNATIMVQNYRQNVTKDALYDAFSDQFKTMKAKLKIKKITLHSNGNKFNGKRLFIDMGNVHLIQDIFVFETGDTTRTLIIQDSVNDDGSSTKEFQDTMDLIRDSLVIKS